MQTKKLANWKLAIFFNLSFIVYHSSLLWAGAGSSAFTFLRVPTGARPVGMGSAFVAMADDINTVVSNPAGLANLSGTNVQLSHLTYLQDVTLQSLLISRAVNNRLVMGGSILSLGYGKILKQVEDTTGNLDVSKSGTSLSANALAISLNGGYDLSMWMPGLKGGFGVKTASENLDGDSASTFLIDLGFLWQMNLMESPLSFGLALTNFGGTIKGDKAPSSITVGTMVRLPLRSEVFQTSLSLEFENPSDGSKSRWAVGVENRIYQQLGLRVGYRSVGARTPFTVGLGFKAMATQSVGYEVNYGFESDSADLGNTHRVSLGLEFK